MSALEGLSRINVTTLPTSGSTAVLAILYPSGGVDASLNLSAGELRQLAAHLMFVAALIGTDPDVQTEISTIAERLGGVSRDFIIGVQLLDDPRKSIESVTDQFFGSDETPVEPAPVASDALDGFHALTEEQPANEPEPEPAHDSEVFERKTCWVCTECGKDCGNAAGFKSHERAKHQAEPVDTYEPLRGIGEMPEGVEPYDWHHALAVACPQCHAMAGQRCRTPAGNVVPDPHRDRRLKRDRRYEVAAQ